MALYSMVLGTTTTVVVLLVGLAITTLISILLRNKVKDLQDSLKGVREELAEEINKVRTIREKRNELLTINTSLQESGKKIEQKYLALRATVYCIIKNPVAHIRYIGDEKVANIRLAKSKTKEGEYNAYPQFGKERIDNCIRLYIGENNPLDDNKVPLEDVVINIHNM